MLLPFSLREIQADLALLAKKLTAADRKMMDVEEFTRQTGRTAQDAAQMKSNRKYPALGTLLHVDAANEEGMLCLGPRSVAEVAQPYPHRQSRASPYPATAISRLYVPDDRLDWQVNPGQIHTLQPWFHIEVCDEENDLLQTNSSGRNWLSCRIRWTITGRRFTTSLPESSAGGITLGGL